MLSLRRLTLRASRRNAPRTESSKSRSHIWNCRMLTEPGEERPHCYQEWLGRAQPHEWKAQRSALFLEQDTAQVCNHFTLRE